MFYTQWESQDQELHTLPTEPARGPKAYQTFKEQICWRKYFLIYSRRQTKLTLKPDKNNARKENYRSVSFRNINAKL